MLARKSFLMFLANLLGAMLGVVAMFFVGRFFEPGPFGMFWFAMSFMAIISAFTKLGFEKAHVKRISQGIDLAKCMGTFIPIKLAIIVVSVTLALTIVILREVTVGWIAATSFSVLLVAIVLSVLKKFRAIIKSTFNALRLTASSELAIFVENLTRLPLVIIVTLAFAFSQGKRVPLQSAWVRLTQWIGEIPPMTDETGAVLYGIAYSLAVLFSLGAAVWLMRRHKIPVGRFDRDLAKSYWIFAWPVAAYTILTSMTQHIDMVMLGYFWTGNEVGFYRAAFQFVAIVMIIPTAVRTLLFPMMSELISNRQWTAVTDLAKTTYRFMGMVMVPILMLTLLYANDVFRIVMSNTWVPSAPALRLLVLNSTLGISTLIISTILLGSDRVKTVMFVNVGGFFLNVSLNVILIPSSILGVPMFGLQVTGAALATVLSKAVTVGVFLVISKRLLGTTFVAPNMPKHLLSAGLAGGILWALEHFQLIQVIRVWELAIASAMGIALYVGFLYILKEFRRKDLLFFLDLLNPGHMSRYVRDELKDKR